MNEEECRVRDWMELGMDANFPWNVPKARPNTLQPDRVIAKFLPSASGPAMKIGKSTTTSWSKFEKRPTRAPSPLTYSDGGVVRVKKTEDRSLTVVSQAENKRIVEQRDGWAVSQRALLDKERERATMKDAMVKSREQKKMEVAGARIHSAQLFLQATRPRVAQYFEEDESERENMIIKGIESLAEDLSCEKRRNQLLQSEVETWMKNCADLDMQTRRAMDELATASSRILVILFVCIVGSGFDSFFFVKNLEQQSHASQQQLKAKDEALQRLQLECKQLEEEIENHIKQHEMQSVVIEDVCSRVKQVLPSAFLVNVLSTSNLSSVARCLFEIEVEAKDLLNVVNIPPCKFYSTSSKQMICLETFQGFKELLRGIREHHENMSRAAMKELDAMAISLTSLQNSLEALVSHGVLQMFTIDELERISAELASEVKGLTDSLAKHVATMSSDLAWCRGDLSQLIQELSAEEIDRQSIRSPGSDDGDTGEEEPGRPRLRFGSMLSRSDPDDDWTPKRSSVEAL
eukprot:749114-Hanusia_phi.AAC.1